MSMCAIWPQGCGGLLYEYMEQFSFPHTFCIWGAGSKIMHRWLKTVRAFFEGRARDTRYVL
eukprot:4111507-Prorocentrum_lima.AAC.1